MVMPIQEVQTDFDARVPLAITGNRYRYYYSSFATILGYLFVADVCRAVIEFKDTSGLKPKSWEATYVLQLENFFSALSEYLKHIDITCSTQVADMTSEQWSAFFPWFFRRLPNLPYNETERHKNASSSRKLFSLLAQKNAIPTDIKHSYKVGKTYLVPIPEPASEIPATKPDTANEIHPHNQLSQNYFVAQIGNKIYEYSDYVDDLGREFLAAVCNAVRIQEHRNTKRLTWLRTYVKQLDYIVESLAAYMRNVAISHPRNVNEFTLSHWRRFVNCVVTDLEDKNISDVTLQTYYSQINSLFSILEAERSIPVKIVICASGSITITKATFTLDQRFFIWKNKHRLYEYSQAGKALGEEFVGGACQVVREQRTSANVIERTWLDNYVVRLTYLFDGITEYLSQSPNGIPSQITGFSEDNWNSFGVWYRRKILNEPLSDKTKSKYIHCGNKLFSLLARFGVIPVRIEMDVADERKQAKDGESEFTKKGWAKKPEQLPTPSPFKFYVPGQRWYDYTLYQPVARAFLMLVVPVLEKWYGNSSAGRAKKIHTHFTNFLRYLAGQEKQGNWPNFFASLEGDEFKKLSFSEWETVIYGWRESLNKDGRKLSTDHSMVKTLDLIWAEISNQKIVPEVSIIGFKNAKKRGQSKPRLSLAQLEKNSAVAQVVDEVWKKVDHFFDNIEKPEALEFIQALCSEFSAEEIEALSLEGVIDKINELNNTRLTALRECAEQEFLFWYEHWERGQAALASAQYSEEQIIYMLDSTILSSSERRANSAALLFNGTEETRLGNALLYVIASRKGTATGLLGRYHHMMRSFGGRFEFHAYLHPHPHASLALWVMLMVDTGANCEVVREMPQACLRKSNTSGKWQVEFSPKGRADGKIIVDELDENPGNGKRLSSVRAIQHYQKMAVRYRQLADDDSKEKLLLHDYSNSIHGLEEFTARAWFKEFLGRHRDVLNWDALPSLIRVTFLMVAQHENAHQVVAAQIMADHSKPSETLISYTGRAPTILHFSLKIREFQDRYQAIIIASIEDAASKLGLTDEEFRHIFSDAARTGLGVACLNPLAGVQPGTKIGEHCTRLDACCGCDMRWVIATVDNVADLILFNGFLKTQKTAMSQSNADGWEKRWLPWLVFSDIALTKLKQGDTAKIYAEAETKAEEKMPTYTPFPLF